MKKITLTVALLYSCFISYAQHNISLETKIKDVVNDSIINLSIEITNHTEEYIEIVKERSRLVPSMGDYIFDMEVRNATDTSMLCVPHAPVFINRRKIEIIKLKKHEKYSFERAVNVNWFSCTKDSVNEFPTDQFLMLVKLTVLEPERIRLRSNYIEIDRAAMRRPFEGKREDEFASTTQEENTTLH